MSRPARSPAILQDLLDGARQLGDDRVALVRGDQEWTYGELAAQVERVAAWLWSQGVRPGDRVAIHLHQTLEEVAALFAVARIGAVFVDVSYQWTPAQLDYVVADCQVRTLITDARQARRWTQEGRRGPLERVLVVGRPPAHAPCTAWSELPEGAAAGAPLPGSHDLAALLYTSGSTGSPKGVMLTHANLVLGAQSVVSYLGNRAEDRLLGLLPLNFDYGLSQVTTAVLVGATVVLQPVAMPAEILRTVQRHAVTGFAAVPPIWIQLVDALQESPQRLASLRYVTNSGGKIPRRILDVMPEVFPGVDIFLMYGLTEAFRSTYLPPHRFAEKRGSIGRAIPNAAVYVVHPERGVCGPGETGELIHRGPLISAGYWGRPEETARKIKVCPALVPWIGEEKVLHSGDLVRRDEEGDLWFVGRGDSMIKCSGYRLSPNEVEDVLASCAGVREVVAFGVEDEALGQVVEVSISCDDPALLTEDGVLGFCMETMPQYMVPRRVHFRRGPFPRTASGKVDRVAVIREARTEAVGDQE